EVTRHEPSTVMPPARTAQRKGVIEKPNNVSARVAAAIKEVEALHSSVARLKGDLDRKLMVLYARNGMTTNFLNRYLNLLEETPDSDVVLWARYALECSQQCDRHPEIL